jgi:hypothetical protein
LGSDTYTATSIAFVNPGSAGPSTGIFAGFNCSNCVNMNNFSSGTATPFTVFTVTNGANTDVVTLSSDVFNFNAGNNTLTITGFGNSVINGGAATPVSFSLTTQVAGQVGPTFGPTSYSGSISTVPLPGTLALFGSGLVGLIALGRKRKQSAHA